MTLNLKRLREMEYVVDNWERDINSWANDDHRDQISNVSASDIAKLVDAVREQDDWIERAKEIFQKDVDNGYHDDRKELLDEAGE